jgi:hypothetical protein
MANIPMTGRLGAPEGGDEGHVAESVILRIFRLLLLLRMCGGRGELGTSGAVGG